MKACSLVRGQYAAVGAAAIAGLDPLAKALEAARARGVQSASSPPRQLAWKMRSTIGPPITVTSRRSAVSVI
jgi:hypothetical protein